jgi:hypothetical protein
MGYPMKVSLATHGGHLAGFYLQQPAQVVDAASLPKDGADELTRLVAAAKAAPSQPQSKLARDATSYTITIENGDPTVLVQSDGTMSPAFVALRNWIKTHAARK